jgi:transposase
MDTQVVSIIAVDVSKDTLEVLIGPNSQAVSMSNCSEALRRLLKKIKALPNLHFICEATGGYERTLVNFLHENRITVSIVSPSRVRDFARSEGVKAKTDPIDAKMLLRFAQEKELRPTTPPTPQRQEILARMDRRSHLAEQLKREKTRLKNSRSAIHSSIRQMCDFIKLQLKEIEAQIKELIRSDQNLKFAYKVLTAVTGIGQVSAWTIIAYMPELGQLTRNEVVALAGLAPYNQDSGKTQKPRRIFGGRAKVRKCLYLAALTASTHNSVIKTYVEGLKKRGKHHKSALTAAMRKLIIHCHYLLKKHEIVIA